MHRAVGADTCAVGDLMEFFYTWQMIGLESRFDLQWVYAPLSSGSTPEQLLTILSVLPMVQRTKLQGKGMTQGSASTTR
jgi:hypothetical protein